ncbi:MAG: HK97 family phage prohead protease [Actinobacteria bacterium]|nr:HK97 family phage prohead protease [Actinomycetota bacterium]
MHTRLKPPKLCYRAVEFRASDPVGDGRTLEGYAAVFNEPTSIDSWEGSFDEQIGRGAFSKTLSERTPVLQFDHGRDTRTGSLPIGAIQDIKEDQRGLFVSARLFENGVVEPIRQAIEAGAIDGMSFRFRVIQDEWRDKDGKKLQGEELLELLWDGAGDRGPLVRTIKEVELFELGPVVFPAYDSTSVGVRSLLAQLDPAQQAALVHELVRTVDEEPGDDDADSEPEPSTTEDVPEAAERTSGEPPKTEPAVSHSVYPGEAADWYLPAAEKDIL